MVIQKGAPDTGLPLRKQLLVYMLDHSLPNQSGATYTGKISFVVHNQTNTGVLVFRVTVTPTACSTAGLPAFFLDRHADACTAWPQVTYLSILSLQQV